MGSGQRNRDPDHGRSSCQGAVDTRTLSSGAKEAAKGRPLRLFDRRGNRPLHLTIRLIFFELVTILCLRLIKTLGIFISLLLLQEKCGTRANGDGPERLSPLRPATL